MHSLFQIVVSLFIFSAQNPPPDWVKWKKESQESFDKKLSAPTATHHIYISDKAGSTFIDMSGKYPRFSKDCKNCEIQLTTGADQKITLVDKKYNTKIEILVDQEVMIPKRENLFVTSFHAKEKNEYRFFIHDLSQKDLSQKRKRNFFAYDPDWKVKGRMKWLKPSKKVTIQRSDGSTKEVDHFAQLEFVLAGQKQTLAIYNFMENDSYKDIPMALLIFRDLSNGKKTYGAGRFLNLQFDRKLGEVKDGEELNVDFNFTYNPPCAVSTGYHCPLPRDLLNTEVLAGESFTKLCYYQGNLTGLLSRDFDHLSASSGQSVIFLYFH